MSYSIIVLGSVQDGGYPQIGCDSACCSNVNESNRFVSCLSIVDNDSGQFWLIDITPDFRHQINKYFSNLKSRNVEYDHSSEHRLQTAIETRLFPDRRTLERALTKPRMGKTKRVEWDRPRKARKDRLE